MDGLRLLTCMLSGLAVLVVPARSSRPLVALASNLNRGCIDGFEQDEEWLNPAWACDDQLRKKIRDQLQEGVPVIIKDFLVPAVAKQLRDTIVQDLLESANEASSRLKPGGHFTKLDHLPKPLWDAYRNLAEEGSCYKVRAEEHALNGFQWRSHTQRWNNHSLYSWIQHRALQQSVRNVMKDISGAPVDLHGGNFFDCDVNYFAPGDYYATHTDNAEGRYLAVTLQMSLEWKPEWGGHFTWCGPTRQAFTVEQGFNRAVLFPVHSSSVHFVEPVWLDSIGKESGPPPLTLNGASRVTLQGWYSDPCAITQNQGDHRDLEMAEYRRTHSCGSAGSAQSLQSIWGSTVEEQMLRNPRTPVLITKDL